MTGAFYPAVDLCAGEKERGTLETLLCSPAERVEIVWGKLLTIMVFSVTTAVLNLACMSLTSTYHCQPIPRHDGRQHHAGARYAPFPLVHLAILALVADLGPVQRAVLGVGYDGPQHQRRAILLDATDSADDATVDSADAAVGRTRSWTVVGAGVRHPLVVASVDGAKLLASSALLRPRDCVTGACCWIAARWAVDQFNNESVLFRESERFSLQLWAKQLDARSHADSIGGAGLLVWPRDYSRAVFCWDVDTRSR